MALKVLSVMKMTIVSFPWVKCLDVLFVTEPFTYVSLIVLCRLIYPGLCIYANVFNH